MTDHILGHKTSPNKFKRTEIIGSIFSDQNSIKLQIRGGKKMGKHKQVETKQHSIKKNYWDNEEVRGNQKIPGDE